MNHKMLLTLHNKIMYVSYYVGTSQIYKTKYNHG